MNKYKINNIEYSLEKDFNKCFNKEEVEEKMTDYFNEFDYVFGDYAYDKLRLKGFYNDKNKKVSAVNNIKDLDDYVANYCAYGAKWFLLKKIK